MRLTAPHSLTYVILISQVMGGCGTSNPNDNPVARVQIHAHRGGAAIRPENSLSAFGCAISEIGVDSVELDIRQTADHQLVIQHDARINPTLCLDPTGQPILVPPVISTMSLAEVRSYDCGPLNGLPAGTPLPTLDEVFEATSGLRTPWGQAPSYDLHVKWEKETIDAATYASLVLASVRGHGVLERVHFMTDTSELLGAAKQQEPALSLYYLIGATNPQKLADAASLGVEALVPAGPTLSEGDVRAIHAIGAQVIAWTVNQPVAWASLGRSGVDGIITDNPIGLRQLQQGNSSSQSLGYVEDPEMPLED